MLKKTMNRTVHSETGKGNNVMLSKIIASSSLEGRVHVYFM
jgi:hypothetical protein